MNVNVAARRLFSEERRHYQDPLKISKTMGVKRRMTVADLGCGPGFFTLPLASLVGPEGLVYAIDAHPTMLKHLRANIKKSGANGKKIKVARADVSRSRIPSASVDVVLFARLLHHIKDKGSFAKEVRRICRPGAVVVDIDWRKAKMERGPPYEIRLSEAEVKRILTGVGFHFLRSIDAGRYHYGLVLRKATIH